MPSKDLLALVWVHGFKGNDVTFEHFPERVTKILEDTHPSLRVQSHVFPAYQTRGELSAATEHFVEWLATKVVALENDHGAGRGAGSAQVVLCGHSMGGLLIADAAQRIAQTTREGDPMWPNVVGILAFDTPYLGLHPHVFKHHLSRAASHLDTAKTLASNLIVLSPFALGLGFGKKSATTSPAPTPSRSGTPANRPPPTPAADEIGSALPPSDAAASSSSKPWFSLPSIPAPSGKAMYGLGALALGAAAAGTAYYRRDDLVMGWTWGYEHMTFVRALWDDNGMCARLDNIDRLGRERAVVFANFFTHLPPSGQYTSARTFALLPPRTHPTFPHWRPATNTRAADEVGAHMYMFNGRTNDGFYELGLAVVRVIGERIEAGGVERGVRVDAEVEVEDEGTEGTEGIEVAGRQGEEGVPGTTARVADGWRVEHKDGTTVWVEE
ncbi:hypothetical protein Q5752_003298 [Cryptotrichosporon argae]